MTQKAALFLKSYCNLTLPIVCGKEQVGKSDHWQGEKKKQGYLQYQATARWWNGSAVAQNGALAVSQETGEHATKTNRLIMRIQLCHSHRRRSSHSHEIQFCGPQMFCLEEA
jgi:hypothetical protein